MRKSKALPELPALTVKAGKDTLFYAQLSV
jgi:hypothetical protein